MKHQQDATTTIDYQTSARIKAPPGVAFDVTLRDSDPYSYRTICADLTATEAELLAQELLEAVRIGRARTRTHILYPAPMRSTMRVADRAVLCHGNNAGEPYVVYEAALGGRVDLQHSQMCSGCTGLFYAFTAQ